MSIITTRAGASALAATLAIGIPSTALAHGPGHRGVREGAVPSRIATKLRAAERALDRAQEHAHDGESTAAGNSLRAVRRNLAAALKSAKRRTAGDSGTGVASVAAVTRVDHDAA